MQQYKMKYPEFYLNFAYLMQQYKMKYPEFLNTRK
jgi:hypothetical protein